jgi:hypothetical protein
MISILLTRVNDTKDDPQSAGHDFFGRTRADERGGKPCIRLPALKCQAHGEI